MIPYVAAPVHYVNYGAPADDPTQCRCAFVTALDPSVETQPDQAIAILNVLNPKGNILADRRAVQDEVVHQGGTWHWPDHAVEAGS